MRITILYDDNKINDELLNDHGFSALIEIDDQKILFDTGQKEEILVHNAKKLGINLDEIKYVVLSHGHYDHTGGVSYFINKAKIFAHPAIFEDKYRDKNGKEYIGIPIEFKDKLKDKIILNQKNIEILSNVHLSGEINIKQKTDLYHKTRQGITNDWMNDEQFLAIETKDGIVIVTGCSHKGTKNIVDHVFTNFKKRIYAVVGGLHLRDTSVHTIAETAKYLANFTKLVYFCHCTGNKAGEMISNVNNGIKIGAGSVIVL